MTTLIFIQISPDNYVTSQIYGEKIYPGKNGQLPPIPSEAWKTYDTWHQTYISKATQQLNPEEKNIWKNNYNFRLNPSQNQPEEVINNAYDLTQQEWTEVFEKLEIEINKWLDQAIDSQWIDFRDFLRDEINQRNEEEVVIVINAQNEQIQKLPLQLWSSLKKKNVEVIINFINVQPFSTPKNENKSQEKVRILAIKGSGDELDKEEEEKKILDKLEDVGAEIEWLFRPNLTDFKTLWDQKWDIFYFTGHTYTQRENTKSKIKKGKRGMIQINPSICIQPQELEKTWKKAIKNGLKMAIFNSCDGYGIAEDLSLLGLPLIIFMREPIPDSVGITFLDYFIRHFAGGKSLYKSLSETRVALSDWEGVEKSFPGISSSPLIAQNYINSDNKTITWNSLFNKEKFTESNGEQENDGNGTKPDVIQGSEEDNIIIKGNKYRIRERLGEGGFAIIHLAENVRNNNQKCVVKELKYFNNNPEKQQKAQELFEREADILSSLNKLSYLQIPKFFDSDLDRQDGKLYLVEEYIEGQTLKQIIDQNEKWTSNDIIFFLKEMLIILKYLHENNIIHRDIKPSNIIRKPDNRYFLIDFGAAKKFKNNSYKSQILQPNNQSETIIGTKLYISNEQMNGNVQFSSDIYSLGKTAIHFILDNNFQWDKSLINILNKMTQDSDSKKGYHYQTAQEVIDELDLRVNFSEKPTLINHLRKLGVNKK